MPNFNKILHLIRSTALRDTTKFLAVFGTLSALSIIGGILLDVYLPFQQPWQLVRGIVMPIAGISLFVTGYGLVFYLRALNPVQSPTVREKFSPSWRRKIATIIAIILLVAVYANQGGNAVYTMISAIVVATVLFLAAFLRLSKEERAREDLDIPDYRDIIIADAIKERTKNLSTEKDAKNDVEAEKVVPEK